jgi:hypothetical protein
MSIEHIELNRGTSAQLFKLPQQMIDYLWECIDVAKKKKICHKKKLAGYISTSYNLEDPQNLVVPNLFKILEKVRHNIELEIQKVHSKISHTRNDKLEPRIDRLWVNFQKKGDFQPVHNHSGLFSFVIWMDIPYHWEDEAKLPFAKANNVMPPGGNFTFLYPDGESRSTYEYIIPLSPSMNGYCCFFPSDLCHQVYPFYTSDKERISISGNIILKPALAESQPPVVRAVDQTSFIISNT